MTDATATLDVVEPTTDQANGHVEQTDLEVEGQSRKLKLRAKSTAKPHQCGQQRLDDLAPTRPEQLAIDDQGDDEDLDAGDHPEDADDLEDQLEDALVEADAVHAIAAPPPREQDEPDDLAELPF